RRAAERLEIDWPCAIGRGPGIHHELELAAGENVEELPVVVATLELLTVHREDEVAGREFDVVVIGRAFAEDIADLVVAARIGLHLETGMTRGDALLGWSTDWQASAARNSGMRGVHIAGHFHDQIV